VTKKRPHPRLNIGPALRAARERAGWSQQELASRAETSVGVISTIERGKLEPGLGLATRIANALGVSLDSLLPAEEPKPEVAA